MDCVRAAGDNRVDTDTASCLRITLHCNNLLYCMILYLYELFIDMSVSICSQPLPCFSFLPPAACLLLLDATLPCVRVRYPWAIVYVCLTYVCVRLGHDTHPTRKEKLCWRGGGGAGAWAACASPGKAGAAGGDGGRVPFHEEGADPVVMASQTLSIKTGRTQSPPWRTFVL